MTLQIIMVPVNENLEEETFGMLFFANIDTFEDELHSEMEKIIVSDSLPEEWT